MSMWYRRSEAQKRFSLFFNGASLAGAFGGLLASAIGNLDGVLGHHGWKWIFWIEGAFTCIISVAAFFLITDFPEDTKWLVSEERDYLIAKLAEDQGESGIDEKITVASVLKTFKNWRMVLSAVMYFGPTVSGYGKSGLLEQLSLQLFEGETNWRFEKPWRFSALQLWPLTVTAPSPLSSFQYHPGPLLLSSP